MNWQIVCPISTHIDDWTFCEKPPPTFKFNRHTEGIAYTCSNGPSKYFILCGLISVQFVLMGFILPARLSTIIIQIEFVSLCQNPMTIKALSSICDCLKCYFHTQTLILKISFGCAQFFICVHFPYLFFR